MARHYFESGKSKTYQDLIPGSTVAVTLEEFAPVEQSVHSETDVWIVHLLFALAYNKVTIEGVMHHNKNRWFTTCK